MGNLLPTEIIYDDLPRLSQVKRGVALKSWSALATGRIREMHLWCNGVSFTNKYFQVRKNKAPLFFSFAELLMLTSSDTYDAKLALDIPVTFGELMSFDIQSFGIGSITTPLVFLMVTEEGA